MATTIPTTEPEELTAGESWEWDRTVGDYPPSDGWTLKYALRGPHDLDITADALGDTYQVRLPAATTEPVTAGVYTLTGYVEDGAGARHIVYQAEVSVAANPLTAVNAKGWVERTLDVVEAKLEGRLSADLESYQIHGRAVNKIPIAELRAIRKDLLEELRQERNPGFFTQRVEVRFVRPV